MRSHHFKKFGFEGKARQGESGGGVGLFQEDTEGLEGEDRGERGGTGGPEILRRQCPSQRYRHGCGWSVRPSGWGVGGHSNMEVRLLRGHRVNLCLCDCWTSPSPSAALTRKKRPLEGATGLVSSGRWESKELAQRSRAGLVS